MKDGCWIFEAWFRDEAKRLFIMMDGAGIEHILRNLTMLDRIDYHAEEVLYSFAHGSPERVLHFLIERVSIETQARTDKGTREFEAIPYEFHKLHEVLSKIPGTAVRRVREQYRADKTLFTYRGPRLLKNILPRFSNEFEAELVQLIREGDASDLEFVLAVIRSYR